MLQWIISLRIYLWTKFLKAEVLDQRVITFIMLINVAKSLLMGVKPMCPHAPRPAPGCPPQPQACPRADLRQPAGLKTMSWCDLHCPFFLITEEVKYILTIWTFESLSVWTFFLSVIGFSFFSSCFSYWFVRSPPRIREMSPCPCY